MKLNANDLRKVFENEFSVSFACGSSTYTDRIDLDDGRAVEWKITNTTGSQLNQTSSCEDCRLSVNVFNPNVIDPEFETDKHGTLARIDNYHFLPEGGRDLHAHAGDKVVPFPTTPSISAYVAGSVFLTSEIMNLLEPK